MTVRLTGPTLDVRPFASMGGFPTAGYDLIEATALANEC
jgi:hypothetical protein